MLFNMVFLNTLTQADNYFKSNVFLINESKNHIILKLKQFETVENDLGKFQNSYVKFTFNNCDPFYISVIYLDDYSYVKNNSEIIEIDQDTKGLYLNIYQSKILKQKFGFYEFKDRFIKTKKNSLKFYGIKIHKRDFNCISQIEKSNKKNNYNFYTKIKKNKKLSFDYNFKDQSIKPYLNIKNFHFKNKNLKIYKNSLSFDNFINKYGERWSENNNYRNYYKKNIIDNFELNLIVEDLFINTLQNKQDTTYMISCKINKGAIRILLYNEKDNYINKITICSKNKLIKFKLKKNETSKLVVSSYMSDFTYKHLKFSLDLFYK